MTKPLQLVGNVLLLVVIGIQNILNFNFSLKLHVLYDLIKMTVMKDFIMTMIKGLNSLKLSKQVLKTPVFRYASNLKLL